MVRKPIFGVQQSFGVKGGRIKLGSRVKMGLTCKSHIDLGVFIIGKSIPGVKSSSRVKGVKWNQGQGSNWAFMAGCISILAFLRSENQLLVSSGSYYKIVKCQRVQLNAGFRVEMGLIAKSIS